MNQYPQNYQQRGFIKWIILIIIAIVLASYFFNFSVEDAVQDPQTQSNFSYIWTNIVNFWNQYLAQTASYLWNDIFIDLLWDNFVDVLQRIDNGEQGVFDDLAPRIDLNS